MKKESLKQKKGNKGITLVALVVTIVVLLILAGITISTLFGDNGIITGARRAAELTKNSVNDTDKALNNLNSYITSQLNGTVEPKNIEDWIYELDKTTNTITILKYKGKDTEVVIPSSIGGVKVKSIGDKSEEDVRDIGTGDYSINYSIWDMSICSNNAATYGCPQETITKITISEGIEEINCMCFASSRNLKEVIIPNSVNSIKRNAFAGCSNLTNIKIPDSVINIGDWTFAECTNLTNITIPSSVSNMGEFVFAGNSSVITVIVPFNQGQQPAGWSNSWSSPNSGRMINIIYKDSTPSNEIYQNNTNTSTNSTNGI